MAHFQCSEKKIVSSEDCYKCFKKEKKKEFVSRVICKARHIVQAEGEVIEKILKELNSQLT